MEFKNNRNPILPLDIHIPDGEAHVMPDGKLYIYGSWDQMEEGYCSDQYRVVSTPDMEHWTIHDVSFEGRQVPWFFDPDAPKYPGIDWENPTPFIRKILKEEQAAKEKSAEMDTKTPGEMAVETKTESEQPPLLYAPDAAYKDGKYYLYFCMADDSEGVAVSERPEGPFADPVQLPCGGIDPAVFVDTDGQAYYYWGQLFAHGVKLNPDMVSFEQENVVHNLITEEEHFFHEGSSMRKIGDTYYLVYSDMERGRPTSLGYATGKSPLGPFTYRGILIDNAACDPESWNNHGSIEEIHGQWYVFYHRSSRGTRIHRRLCVEPITILPDGSIPEVKMTSQGAGKPFGSGEKICGYQACELFGSIFIGLDGKGSECLENIGEGDCAVFRYVETDGGFHAVSVEAKGEGCIEIYFNEKLAGSVSIGEGQRKNGVLIDSQQGKKELKLRFRNVKDLKVMSLMLK